MARLKNFSVKNLKSFVGREGPAYQAGLYYNNKKIGFWSQDGDGAICDSFSFDDTFFAKKLRDAAQEMFPESSIPEEMFMESLLELTLKEKNFKKMTKNGGKAVTMIFHPSCWQEMLLAFPETATDEEMIQSSRNIFYKEVLKENESYSKNAIVVEIYRGLKDFVK